MSSTTNLSALKINYLSQAEYDEAVSEGEINENEIYMTPQTDAGIPADQGVANAGKFLAVGNDGVVIPVALPLYNGGVT